MTRPETIVAVTQPRRTIVITARHRTHLPARRGACTDDFTYTLNALDGHRHRHRRCVDDAPDVTLAARSRTRRTIPSTAIDTASLIIDPYSANLTGATVPSPATSRPARRISHSPPSRSSPASSRAHAHAVGTATITARDRAARRHLRQHVRTTRRPRPAPRRSRRGTRRVRLRTPSRHRRASTTRRWPSTTARPSPRTTPPTRGRPCWPTTPTPTAGRSRSPSVTQPGERHGGDHRWRHRA